MFLLLSVGIPVVLLIGYLLFSGYRRKHQKQKLSISMAESATQRLGGLDFTNVNPGKYPMSAAQRKRRSVPIAAYVGFNGSAKSATMVWDTLPDLAAGKLVLSTLALLASEKAESPAEAEAAWIAIDCVEMRPKDDLVLPHPQWIPFKDFRQMMDFRDGVILMDEVQGIADSRDSMGLPVQVRNILFQLRRNKVILRWTTIDWSSADKRIRTATQAVTYCVGFMPKFNTGELWGRKQLFWLRSYDAKHFDDFTEARHRKNEKNKLRPSARQWVRLFGGLKLAIETYDSSGQVLTLGASNEAGMCMTCGGRRRAKSCACADHSGKKDSGTTPARKRSENGRLDESPSSPVDMSDQILPVDSDADLCISAHD